VVIYLAFDGYYTGIQEVYKIAQIISYQELIQSNSIIYHMLSIYIIKLTYMLPY